MAFVVFGLLSAATAPSSCSAVGGGGWCTLAPVVIAEEVLSSGGNGCCGFIGSRSLPSTSGFTLFLFNSPLLRRYAEEDAAVANCNMNWGCNECYNDIICIKSSLSPPTHRCFIVNLNGTIISS